MTTNDKIWAHIANIKNDDIRATLAHLIEAQNEVDKRYYVHDALEEYISWHEDMLEHDVYMEWFYKFQSAHNLEDGFIVADLPYDEVVGIVGEELLFLVRGTYSS